MNPDNEVHTNGVYMDGDEIVIIYDTTETRFRQFSESINSLKALSAFFIHTRPQAADPHYQTVKSWACLTSWIDAANICERREGRLVPSVAKVREEFMQITNTQAEQNEALKN